ncbi:MAG: putative TctA subunit of the Tripartite Tricarboxylate Transport(TTT) Family [Deltaproteobacteria bacterium]|nr:putative TctA subunit of the Tripartite Tricarboxylate Transport(TTT) Family [Deltaproteobacteria bacterium]
MIFDHLVQGFGVAFQLANLFACFVGVLVGTLIGVLPGIGPAAAIAMLLPITFKIDPVTGMIMLAGIYYGAMYGGSTTSILVNIPGEAASVVTCLDGHQMARKGRAGPALGISAFGSFIAGTISIVGLMLVASPLAHMAVRFGPPEYFSLVCLGLITLIQLTGRSVRKGVMMGLFGLLLSFVGLDTVTGVPRFNFGMLEFMNGIESIPMVMGLFGISEVLLNIEAGGTGATILKTKIKGLFPGLEDWKQSIGAISRGSVLGFLLGVLPGGGTILASFISYATEKKISKHPEKFGTGTIEGVAGPEAANNAAVGGSFIPLTVLGIPTNVVIAILMGALVMHGIRPGPNFIQKYPDMFWGFVASMYLGNAMLLVLNLPLIPLWVQVLRVPYRILFPLILLFVVIGSYSVNLSRFDLALMLIFGVMGYLLRKFDYELAPLILAFILGPMLEEAFRQSLIMSEGSFSIFVARPASLIFLLLALMLLLSSLIPAIRKKYAMLKE